MVSPDYGVPRLWCPPIMVSPDYKVFCHPGRGDTVTMGQAEVSGIAHGGPYRTGNRCDVPILFGTKFACDGDRGALGNSVVLAFGAVIRPCLQAGVAGG